MQQGKRALDELVLLGQPARVKINSNSSVSHQFSGCVGNAK